MIASFLGEAALEWDEVYEIEVVIHSDTPDSKELKNFRFDNGFGKETNSQWRLKRKQNMNG